MNNKLLCCLFVFLSIAAAASAQSPPIVKISAWEAASNGTGVRFTTGSPTSEELKDVKEALTDETPSGRFKYGIDTSNIKWRDGCRCFEYYIVTVQRLKPTAATVVTRNKFKAIPSGTFNDQLAAVTLTIGDEAGDEIEDVALPVASAPGLETPLAEITAMRTLESVPLGGTTVLQVTVHNRNGQVPVVIGPDLAVSTADGTLWKRRPALTATGELPLSLAPGHSETLQITLEPNLAEVVERSLKPTKGDKEHTKLHLEVGHTNPIFRNRTSTARLDLPIRFQPSILSLVAALAIGVLLGRLVQTLARGDRSVRRWLLASSAALVVGFIFELIAIFLVAHDSQFVLFSFEIDPWQTLPVVLLGIGNGLLGFDAALRLAERMNLVKS